MHPKTSLRKRVTRRRSPYPPGADDADSAARRGRVGWRRGRTHERYHATPS